LGHFFARTLLTDCKPILFDADRRNPERASPSKRVLRDKEMGLNLKRIHVREQ